MSGKLKSVVGDRIKKHHELNILIKEHYNAHIINPPAKTESDPGRVKR